MHQILTMCGRYIITSPPEALRQLLEYLEQPNFPPRHNVAPTQPVPVVRLWEGRRQFALVRWGFIPAWVKDPRAFSLVINARSDTVLEKPAFRNAIRRRRCLVPADGFYEWKVEGGRRQPYAVLPRRRGPIAFAGIWEAWMGPNGEEIESAAIVTTEASAALRPLHARMPVVVPPQSFATWLDCLNVDAAEAARLMVPAPDDFFEAYPVSDAVNRVANDTPDLLTPLAGLPPAEPAPPPASRARAKLDDGAQGSLF